jgi:hypothetical protein
MQMLRKTIKQNIQVPCYTNDESLNDCDKPQKQSSTRGTLFSASHGVGKSPNTNNVSSKCLNVSGSLCMEKQTKQSAMGEGDKPQALSGPASTE